MNPYYALFQLKIINTLPDHWSFVALEDCTFKTLDTDGSPHNFTLLEKESEQASVFFDELCIIIRVTNYSSRNGSIYCDYYLIPAEGKLTVVRLEPASSQKKQKEKKMSQRKEQFKEFLLTIEEIRVRVVTGAYVFSD